MKYWSAAEMVWPTNFVLQMIENLFIRYRAQEMSHRLDFSLVQTLSFSLFMSHIAIVISVKIITI